MGFSPPDNFEYHRVSRTPERVTQPFVGPLADRLPVYCADKVVTFPVLFVAPTGQPQSFGIFP